MLIKYITLEETLPLRSQVLRTGKPLEQCLFPTDSILDAFHLGGFVADRLVVIATFFPDHHPDFVGKGFKLRGMATDPEFSGRGHGAELIKFAVKELRSAQGSYIWCNARSSAVVFYQKLGFELISAEYEIPGVGPHFNMIKHLDQDISNQI